MNEPDDKPLHDWVRQSLHTYRPAVNPQDWQRMQRALRRRRWWRNGIIGSIALLALLITGWFWLSINEPEGMTNHSASTAPASTHRQVLPEPLLPVEQKPAPTASVRRASRPVWAAGVLNPLPVRRFQKQNIALLQPRNQLIPLSNPAHHLPSTIAFSGEELAIEHQMITGDFGSDSTSYLVLDRNLRQWPNAVIVCDLTTSMYPYSTQLFAWFRKHARSPAVNGIVFFTDCDSLGNQTRPNGPPGRMFVVRNQEPVSALPVMLRAARNTIRNDDDAENDVEALLFAQQTFPDAKHLILLADNMSTVKDMHRLGGLHKPIHIVLCGTTGSDINHPFQSAYFTLASSTQGSLHTLEDDTKADAISASTVLHVGTRYYRYNTRKKQFKLTPFNHRPVHILGLFWL